MVTMKKLKCKGKKAKIFDVQDTVSKYTKELWGQQFAGFPKKLKSETPSFGHVATVLKNPTHKSLKSFHSPHSNGNALEKSPIPASDKSLYDPAR